MEASPDKPRRAILVLGPHRSGTSVVARALLAGGAALGRDLLGGNQDNPRGFFENARIVAFNDRLLRQLDLCWDYLGPIPAGALPDDGLRDWRDEAAVILHEEFDQAPLIAIKDPRLCLLAPFWDAALRAAGFQVAPLLVLRRPAACAASLCARHQRDPAFHFVGAEPDEALLLWGNYMQTALAYLDGRQCTTARYDDFIQAPDEALRTLFAALQIAPADAGQTAAFTAEFLDPQLRHHAGTSAHSELGRRLETIHDRLAQAEAVAPPAIRQQLRTTLEAADRMGHLQALFVRARHAAVEHGLRLRQAEQDIAALREELERLEQSRVDQIAAAKQQFVSERQRVEALELALATRQDLLDRLQGHEDLLLEGEDGSLWRRLWPRRPRGENS